MNPFEQIARGLYERYLLYGDRAVRIYLEKLKEQKWETTRCPACERLYFPPRTFCPKCLSEELEWVPLPRRGKVATYAWQERALFFGKPDCIGHVELENGIRLFAPILAPIEKLKVGMEVEQDFFPVAGIFKVPVFKPV